MEGEGHSIVGIYGKKKLMECRSLWKEKISGVMISMEGEGHSIVGIYGKRRLMECRSLWKEKISGVMQ
jgi:hypothetical protein